jgi:hypothetical protein
MDPLLERQMRSLLEGCPSMGRKSAWAAPRAEVMASEVMVAGWEILGQVASLEN